MGISKTRKEKAVIIFFALTLVVIIAMAVINPKPPSEDHDHAEDSAQAASLDEKIAQAKESLKAAPNNVHDIIRLGDLLTDNNQLKEAISVFSKAINLEPQNVHALNDLAVLYQKTGFYEKSFEMFKAVEKIEPENLSALYNLGMLNKYYKKDNKEALKYFEKLLSKDIEPSLSQGITKEIENIKAEMK